MAIAPSRFAGLSTGHARLVLLAFAFVMLAGVLLSFSTATSKDGVEGANDLSLYRAVIERMKHGESYYPVAASELREHSYALRPALNFRLPTLATLLALLPGFAGLLLLRTLAASVVIAWVARFRRDGMRWPHATAAGAVLFTGVGLAVSEAALVWHEVWSGLLTALALAVHGRRTWGVSVGLALCAVLIRELALPLPLIMLALSVRERRLGEAAAWLSVILAFLAALSAHLFFATQQLLASDPANGWVAIGGWGFILATAKWNLLLSTAPTWLNALIVPTAIIGLAGLNERAGGRALAALCSWLVVFFFLGRPDNHYWGLIYAPLLALGCVFAAPSLLALIQTALPAPDRPAPDRPAPDRPAPDRPGADRTATDQSLAQRR